MREVEAKEEGYIPEQNIIMEYLGLIVYLAGGSDTPCKLVKVFWRNYRFEKFLHAPIRVSLTHCIVLVQVDDTWWLASPHHMVI